MSYERRYYTDRSTEITSTVREVSCDGDKAYVRLEQTIFHPQGGGQKADVGSIDEVAVLGVVKGDGEAVLHQVDPAAAATFRPGQTVRLQVDAVTRTRHSALHTAGHLIAGIVEQLDSSLKAVQGHHWPGESRVEFAGTPADPAALERQLPNALASAITADPSVTLAVDADSGRRVTIAGYPPVPCGGTHVVTLAELGRLTVRGVKSKGGKVRIGYEVELPVATAKG